MNQRQCIAMAEICIMVTNVIITITITIIAIVINIIIVAIMMSLMEQNKSGTIDAKEMIEIVGNLCELEGVAKVEIWLRMEKLEREKRKQTSFGNYFVFPVWNSGHHPNVFLRIFVCRYFDWGIFLFAVSEKWKWTSTCVQKRNGWMVSNDGENSSAKTIWSVSFWTCNSMKNIGYHLYSQNNNNRKQNKFKSIIFSCL